MNIKDLIEKLARVSDIYAQKYSIERSDDWFILKLQEELGELAAAHLKLTQRARVGEKSQASLEENLKEEIADVLAMTLLFAKHKNIDVEKAIQDKWFQYLK